MGDCFSFDSADELIQLLKTVHTVMGNQSDKLMLLYNHLGSTFRDDGYWELKKTMNSAYSVSQSARQQLGLIIASLVKYKQELYQLYTEDLITQIGFEHIAYDSSEFFQTSTDELEQKNRQLAFQNEIRAKIRNHHIPNSAKEMYAAVGSKCKIESNAYQGTAFYSPHSGFIKFNLNSDLSNPCGTLSTYFHEIGHMIDYQAASGRCLSDDTIFINALRADCEKYLDYTKQRYGCNRENACYHISQELMSDNNLYSDVSDILGGLTKCQCQNLWGHSLSYWTYDSKRIQREAFANMYSVALGSKERIDAMKKYFPTAYARFEQILEELR